MDAMPRPDNPSPPDLAAIAGLLALAATACQPAAVPVAPAASAPPAATYDLVATRVLSSCSTRSCHGTLGAKGGLVLTADVAYAQLVGVPADNAAAKAKGKKRVVPGDPDASFLVQKLTAPGAGEGDRMPEAGDPIAAEDLDLLRRWIAAGAPR